MAGRNRESSRLSRPGRGHWCMGCDAFRVVRGQRCPVCGRRPETRAGKVSTLRRLKPKEAEE